MYMDKHSTGFGVWNNDVHLHMWQVVDEKNPIALTSETVVVVNGKKCVLRVDPESNHLVAYPVKQEGTVFVVQLHNGKIPIY